VVARRLAFFLFEKLMHSLLFTCAKWKLFSWSRKK